MPRRRIVLVCLLAVGLVAALAPWTVTSDRVTAALTRQIQNEFGVSLTARGPTMLSLLPSPRLTLTDVRLASADGEVRGDAAEIRAELRLLPMVLAQIRLQEVLISKGRITVDFGDDAIGWQKPLADIRRRLQTQTSSRWASRIDRLVISDSEIALARTVPTRPDLRRVSLVVRWPDPAGDVDVSGSFEWSGEVVSAAFGGLNPALLMAGGESPVEGALSLRGSRLEGSGRMTWTTAPRFVGTLSAQTGSLSRLARWTGLGEDWASVDRSVAVAGDVSVEPGKIEWPRAQLDIGRDRFEGALALQLDTPRAQVRATLAGGDLDLGWIRRLIDPRGPDRPKADYDIRLSASAIQVDTLNLRDAAASIHSGPRLVELSLARAGFAGGSIRGRITSATDGEGRDIKSQAWVEGIDMERALKELTAVRGVSGTASGQVVLEIAGDRADEMAGQVRGRASLVARDGELQGPALAEPSRRVQQAAAGGMDWRSGRARFGKASLALEFGRGLAEVTDGTIETAGTQTNLTGRVRLDDGSTTLRAATRVTVGAVQRAPIVVDLSGALPRLNVDAPRDPVATGSTP